MHWRGHSVDMNSRAVYTDVVAEVRAELSEHVERAVGGGIAPDRIILDPGSASPRARRTTGPWSAGWTRCTRSAGRC